MVVTDETLSRLDQHWAIASIDEASRHRAMEIGKNRLIFEAMGDQIAFDFRENAEDLELLDRTATAYELAAIDGLNALLHPMGDSTQEMREQAEAAAYYAYELRRSQQIPKDIEAKIFHVLHISALAYCGDRWAELRRWLKEHENEINLIDTSADSWDKRVLFKNYDCWVRLLRKNQWSDLNKISEIIASLRRDQEQYEAEFLSSRADPNIRVLAFRLVALYHWAKATELIATYMLQGQPASIATRLDHHFEAAREAALGSQDTALDMLLHWLHVTARKMSTNSIWWVAQSLLVTSEFVRYLTKARSMFELLPPQRAAMQEQQLLDPANHAIVVELPTSGGKTILAQFRILQALNQFEAEHGWVAYVAPTRALVSQITRRLRNDFESLGIHVEQLTAAIDIDSFEEVLLASTNMEEAFHILVATPEKLDLVIRNKRISRPLALAIIDEAHNIEDEERGLRIELLLATIKRDCPLANFLLMMPYVPNSEELARWLSPENGKAISFGTSAWQPNDRIVGTFNINRDETTKGGWKMDFESLITTPRARTIHFQGRHQVGPVKPFGIPFSKAKSLINQTGAMAKIFSIRGTSIAVAQKIPDAWSMARNISDSLDLLEEIPPEISLVQRFLADEIGPHFELIEMLAKGVAVHHSALSDETRSLIEWLAETNNLRVLCATTTIAQGLNFPVSSVFLASLKFPYGVVMSKRAFWNLAGRAGRVDQGSVGIVGLAAGSRPSDIRRYVYDATGDLISRLLILLNQIEDTNLCDLYTIIQEDQWTDFRRYIAHLWNERQNIGDVIAETEQVLRNTFGYEILQASSNERSRAKGRALLDATKHYAQMLSEHPENASFADTTGFSPEGVRTALLGLNDLSSRHRLTNEDWEPSSLFGSHGESILPQLIGVMMRVPEIKGTLKEISSEGLTHRCIAEIAQSWVMGKSIEEIAEQFFSETNGKENSRTKAVTKACKGVYRSVSNAGTWGLSALSKMPTSGIDFDTLPGEKKHMINLLPAMLYHGVHTEHAILMRMNAVPRNIAEPLGREFTSSVGEDTHLSPRIARIYLESLKDSDWGRIVPQDSVMSGADYRHIWIKLAGGSLDL
jgi:hypothetical protein